MSAVLEIHDLEILRDGRSVLRVPQLSVEEGEVLAVIGPNGAGKSTLMLTLCGLLPPSRGELRFRGQPIPSRGALAYRRRTSLVLQEPLLMDTSVFDNAASGLRFRGLPRAETQRRAQHWLERLGVAGLAQRSARTLSGGEAQRVSLARALAVEPEILFLDEPFSALDAPTRARLLDDLQTLLSETRQTAVFVTHDLNEALLLGTRVAVLIAGELRQVAAPQQVFSAPADPEIAAFVGVETYLPAQVISQQDGLTLVASDGFQIEALGQQPPGRRVYVCLRPEDITLYTAAEVPASSARNRLSGTVTRTLPQGPLVRVTLDCGFPLTALVTRSSAEEMGLTPGMPIQAAFKASAAHLIPRP